VILITKERDEVQARVEVLSQQVTSQFDRFQTLIWNHELLTPPSFSLFQSYELQRNLLLKVLDFERGCQLDSSNFDRVWRITKGQLNQHNLVCEMLARGDFILMDPEKLVLPIGNLGARVTLYYLNLEGQLHNKRYSDSSKEEHREVKIPEFNNVLQAVLERIPEQLQSWKDVLTKLRISFSSQDSLQVKLTYVHQREAVAQQGELTAGQYISSSSKVYKQLTSSLSQLDQGLFNMGSIRELVSLSIPAPFSRFPSWLRVSYLVGGSILNQQFLGRYESLIDPDSAIPLLTWKGIEWILEDYGLSRHEEKSWDLIYQRVRDSTWSQEAPASVRSNGHFCECPRHFLWAPDALIDSVEYNWPIIPGQFDTAANCTLAYQQFFQVHQGHTDPVCFRAAVFCKFLHYMCARFGVIINVNIWDPRQLEFILNLKLQYHNTRWVRLIEVMAMTHFLYGAHAGFINELNMTKKVEIDNWLRAQRTNSALLMGNDITRAVERMEALQLRHNQRHEDNFRNRGHGLRRY
jgi:hypothetical protein